MRIVATADPHYRESWPPALRGCWPISEASHGCDGEPEHIIIDSYTANGMRVDAFVSLVYNDCRQAESCAVWGRVSASEHRRGKPTGSATRPGETHRYPDPTSPIPWKARRAVPGARRCCSMHYAGSGPRLSPPASSPESAHAGQRGFDGAGYGSGRSRTAVRSKKVGNAFATLVGDPRHSIRMDPMVQEEKTWPRFRKTKG